MSPHTPDGWKVMPGGFCARFRQVRRPRGLDERQGVRIRRRLGAGRQRRSSPRVAAAEPDGTHPHSPACSATSPAAPPTISVLVRPLPRTRRGDAAAGALPLGAQAVDPETPMTGVSDSPGEPERATLRRLGALIDRQGRQAQNQAKARARSKERQACPRETKPVALGLKSRSAKPTIMVPHFNHRAQRAPISPPR